MNLETWVFLFGTMFTCGLCGALGASLAFRWLTRHGYIISSGKVVVIINAKEVVNTGDD